MGLAVAAASAFIAHHAKVAVAEPPAAGVGYGLYDRVVEDLPDVRGALIENDGTIVAALGNGGVVRVQADGQRSTLVPWWPAGQVSYATAIARAPGGGYLVLDAPRSQVVQVSPEGARSVFVDLSLLAAPPAATGMCMDGSRLLVADGAMPRVLVVEGSGTTTAQWTVPSPPGGVETQLRGVASGGGHVFVSDSANCRIVRLDPATGEVTASWGDRGIFPGMFETPLGLAWDGSALMVTDLYNHRVVRFDVDGKTLDQWGMHAVRPREGRGKIHYPVMASASPDGTRAVVAEPFERRVQVFSALPPVDPNVPQKTPLPANDGIASHFSREIAIDGQTLVVFEPESAATLVFDMRSEPPMHVTTLGGPGNFPGQFGQVTTQLVDEAANRIYCVDPVRDAILVFALRRAGEAPKFDPFMGRLVAEVPLRPIAEFAAQRAGGPASLWPVDVQRTPSRGFVLLDADSQRVVELDSSMKPVNAWAAAKGAGRLIAPTQLAVTAQGDVLVVDSADRSVKRFGLADGAFKGSIALKETKRPWGICLFGEGAGARYAITDAGDDGVVVVDPATGEATMRKVARGDKPGEFWEPSAIEFRPKDGRLYVVDHGNHRMQSLQPDGTWENSFGIGRPYVRPRDPKGPQRPVVPAGVTPSAEGAANTLAQFPTSTRQPDGWTATKSTDGRYAILWRTVPEIIPKRDPFAVEVKVVDVRTGQPSTASMSVDARMPHHHHGMNVAPTISQTAPGEWRADNMLFHMPGYWEIYFDMREAGRLERAQVEATIE